ncbi:diacylglycerol/lipid kinase family protein [Acidovorax sp.]|uniref:diacylglycerol/lipid kinase family protein n=1 Tax=Acidovorax sp. TaxID=1872122 RepID=UPI002ACE5FED|nr:diacylglycerol kinase family protein [Acidovorax sp.]MDZ7865698.1 diacylglycerol kinase family protein [Acidovorax sp.]
MTIAHRPPAVHPHGRIHLVVPKRPGADFDLVRAKLEGAFAAHAHDVVWHVPDQRGDIVELAYQAVRDAQADGGLVVAAGGDGTINAVAAAALREAVPMGVIPMGTFNYFSREHGLALDPEIAVQDMLHAMERSDMRPVQVGFVNERMFVVNAAVGLYPRLLAEREMASKRFGRSRMVAILSAVWSMFRPAGGRRWRVIMRTHEGAQAQQEEHLVTTLFVGNNPLQLGRMGLTQAQSVADGGQLGVVLLQPQDRWSVARTVWNAATGQLARDSAVVSMACAEMTVAPASWRPAQVKVAFDGEREWMAPPLRFRVHDKPLWLVTRTTLDRDSSAAPQPEQEPDHVAAEPEAPAIVPLPALGGAMAAG